MRGLKAVAILLLALASGAQAQTNRFVSRPLSLQECIALAAERNLRMQIARNSSQLARYTLKAAQGFCDPIFTLNGNALFVNVPAQFDAKKPGIGVEYEEHLDSFGPGLAGQLPFGLKYALSSISTYEHASSVFSTNAFDPTTQIFQSFPAGIRNSNAWFNVTGITLTQPLLKDFWIDIYRRDIDLSKKQVQVSEFAFRGVLMNLVAKVETVYYDLLLARDEVKVQDTSLTVANRLLSIIRKQVQVGTRTDLDAQLAESDLERVRAALARAQGNYAIQKNNLKNLLTDNLHDWQLLDVEPADQLTLVQEPSNLQESWSNALNKRPEIVLGRLLIETADVNLRYLYNQLFPALNLTGTYGWYTFNHSFSGHLDDVKHGANAYYSAGIILSFPLGNQQARNAYKAGKVGREEVSLGLLNVEKGILTEVEDAIKLADTSLSQVSSTRKAREFAQASLDAQVKQFQAGTTNSFIVLEFQRNLRSAQSSELKSLADYNKAKAKLAVADGTILEKHRINVKVHSN